MEDCLIMTFIGIVSGAVMYSYLIPKIFFKVDIRHKSEDGNPGSSNVIKTVGLFIGIVCMILDVSKAFIPVFISVSLLGIKSYYLIPVVIAPVIGHAFSPLMKFSGGKAVSTTYGALLGLIAVSRVVFVLAVVMFVFRFIIVIRPDSSGVVTSLAVASIITAVFVPAMWLKIATILVSIIVTIKQVQRPDKGDYTVSVWHYSLAFNETGLKFNKT